MIPQIDHVTFWTAPDLSLGTTGLTVYKQYMQNLEPASHQAATNQWISVNNQISKMFPILIKFWKKSVNHQILQYTRSLYKCYLQFYIYITNTEVHTVNNFTVQCILSLWNMCVNMFDADTHRQHS